MAAKKERGPTDASEVDTKASSRRGFLKGSAGLVAGAAAAQLLPIGVQAQQPPNNSGTLQQLMNPNGRAILIKGGTILSMDQKVGDFEKGDVLIQGKKIVSVGPNVEAPKSAIVVDGSNRILMPGFIDTHHHQYQTILRSILADGIIIEANAPGPKNNYATVIGQQLTPHYTPADARIAELISSLSQINGGVITTVDTSQVQLTPEHTDACIAGLKESGRRCLFAYAAGGENAQARTKSELTRLRKQYFASDDQLLTLASGGASVDDWKFARTLNVPIVNHATTERSAFEDASLMGPDIEYIHCARLPDATWKRIADTGGKVSIAPAIEMQMQHGYPPIQKALDHGLRPSISVDVECNMTADLFTVMRAAFLSQRALANEAIIKRDPKAPALLLSRQAIEFATINGATVAHLDSKTGSLTPGKEADVIMLATDRINAAPVNNVPGTVVTLMDTSNVDNVFIAGKVAKFDGKLVGIDLNRVLADANKARDGVLQRANYTRNMFGTCCAT